MNETRLFVEDFLAASPATRASAIRISGLFATREERDENDGNPKLSAEEAGAALLASGVTPDQLERFRRAFLEAWETAKEESGAPVDRP